MQNLIIGHFYDKKQFYLNNQVDLFMKSCYHLTGFKNSVNNELFLFFKSVKQTSDNQPYFDFEPCKYSRTLNQLVGQKVHLFIRYESSNSQQYIYKGYRSLKLHSNSRHTLVFSRTNDFGVFEDDYNTFANNTYGKFIIEDDNTVFLSLTTDRILRQELEIIDALLENPNNQNYPDYHIYFFEFHLDEKSVEKFRNKDSNENSTENFVQNQYYQIQFLNNQQSSNYPEDTFDGQLFIANSPFNISGKTIRIIKDDSLNYLIEKHTTKKKILFERHASSITNPKVTKDIIKKIGEEKTCINLEHFYMGQANCSQIKIGKKIGFYDLGFSLFFNQENKSLKNKIQQNQITIKKNTNFNFFIISHMHFDHLAGICYLDREQLIGNQPLWIFQNISDFKNTAKYIDSILLFLILNKAKVHLIENDEKQYTNAVLGLSRGTGKKQNINNTSILLSLYGEEESMLFSADCSYRYIPDTFIQPYDYLHLCHHGAKLKKKDINTLKELKKKNPEIQGICSVGKNTYRHPNDDHLDHFASCNNLKKISESSYSHEIY